MRVLVTGGGGYIGSIATERLLLRGHDVVVLDNFVRGHRDAVHPDAEVLSIDLRDADAVSAGVAGRKLDAVLHFAALHLVPESVEKPSEYYRTNLIGGLNLLDAVRQAEIPRFVFSSTAAVYGEPDRLPIVEASPKQPITPYGRSKWMVEQILSDFSARYGINYAAFRYFNVAGASARFGEDHRPETHVIPVALQVLLGKRDVFSVYGTDYPTADGTAVRDYVHVEDLVDAHVDVLNRLNISLGAINLGSKAGFSVQEIVDAVQRVTGKDLPVQIGPRRSGDPAALVADSTRAVELLGWDPRRSTMDAMIGSAWEWMQRHPEGYAR
ncbi:MAG TPA: UDP-glucose 4-epimerase GalE [Thermomicrobiales bacterium]|nr:UDP-glucose 4-epimerase GalE [Thermomicrobiales bacterium]